MIENKPTSALSQPGAQVPTSVSTSVPIQLLSYFVEEKLAILGYELVAIEVVNHREKTLRLFIDQLHDKTRGITIEDCVKVTHELDEPLEASDVVMAVFNGPYELEVSSPGVDRPLQKPEAFVRFTGQIARIQTFRSLTAEETTVADYSAKNPKQKNFYGVLRGFEKGLEKDSEANSGAILFGVVPEDGTKKIKNETLIRIPLELVAKAHLEPIIELPEDSQKKKTGAKKS